MPNPVTLGSARSSTKEREKEMQGRKEKKQQKRIKEHRTKPPTQTRTINAIIGEEEQNGKQNREEKEETGRGNPTELP